MGLEIYFPEDIRNALMAANEASASTALVMAEAGGDARYLRAFLQGYRAALSTVALAFGVAPQAIKPLDIKPAPLPSAPRGEP